MDGLPHYVWAQYGGTTTYLNNSGTYYLQCSPSGPGLYTYYSPAAGVPSNGIGGTANNTFNLSGSSITSQWSSIGAVSLTSGVGLTNPNNQNGQNTPGALFSTVAVPGGATDYEVNATLSITGSSIGAVTIYLRATPGSILEGGNTGTFNAEYLYNFNCSGQNCTAGLLLYQVVAGTVTTRGSTTVPVHNGSSFRAMVHGTQGAVYIDNVLYQLFAPVSPSGSSEPGIGVVGATNGIASVRLGSIDTVVPNAVNASDVQTSLQPNQITLHWTPVLDNQGGIGVAYYDLCKNGVWLQHSLTPNYVDTAVSAATSYTYPIVPVDFHLNSVSTTITAKTAPANAIDGRQIGVRTTGTYWGGGGEQIDMRSGNLNFTQPLLKPMGRGGWGVTFSLSYNSQNWRLNDGGVNWLLGEDTGYGFGWTLQAGSITPVYNSYYDIAEYIFTDSTGAQYALSQNSGGVWSSQSSVYVWYDTTASPPRLHFNDGSFWVFGCQSAGTEQDGGTLYPTLMEDSNGNQISVAYNAGVGVTATNSSARIQSITDVRGTPTYTFTYTQDFIPHLASIQNNISTAENYSFTVLYGQPLDTPAGQAFYGTTNLLQSITQTLTQLTTTFAYDQHGSLPYATSGTLAHVTYPYGGYLSWVHVPFSYADETLYEAGQRNLSPSGAVPAPYNYTMSRPPGDSTLTSHSAATWTDVTGNAEKVWAFQTNGMLFSAGLATSYSQQTPGGAVNSQDTYTWVQDPALRPYLGTVVSALDPGQSYGVQKQTVQTLDQYGNLLTQQLYNYGSPGGGVGSLARTYSNTYLLTSSYTSLYIFNRLTLSTVTDGTNTARLAFNTYDATALASVTGLNAHDSTYGTSFVYRCNPTTVTTLTNTVTAAYDIGGNTTYSSNNGVTTSSTINSSTNYAAPSQLTTNSLSTSLSYSSFLGITQATGPNAATASIVYDGGARPSTTTSPSGAVTNYTYADTGNNTNTATTNGHWVKTQLDGFGRTLYANTGYGTGTGTTLSTVATMYSPCGCSPMGKVSQGSQPYAPGGTVYWTTYSYDALGRTVKTALPDGSTTQYVYQGNTVKVTDAASHSKTFTMDAFGNLLTVQEMDPVLNATVTTSYTYDVLNHLIQVSMPRGGTTQTRTFNYNLNGTQVTAFLQSATNPENGTVSYTYNANNLMASKTDALNQQTQYSYDGYNRLTQVSHFPVAGQAEDTSQRVNYYYDTNPFDTKNSFSFNTAGRVAATAYGPVNPSGAYLPKFEDWYNYLPSGLVATKRLQVQQTNSWGSGSTAQVINFDAAYTYDTGGEGKILSVAYPTTAGAAPTYTYSFDAMYRLTGMTDQNNNTDVSGVSYNPANQLTAITYFGTQESRSYNSLNQLTNISAFTTTPPTSQVINKTYTYPTGANIGKISTQTDAISGEVVQYTYDSLNRLLTASTTAGPTPWGQSHTYDSFGNLTAETVTQGSAASVTLAGSSATNQFGGTYDANGRLATGGYVYDVENRISHVSGGNSYAYDTRNRRVWQWNGSLYAPANASPAGYTVYFYGVNGKRLAAYQLSLGAPIYQHQTIVSLNMISTVAQQDAYFGGRRLATVDRVGSAATDGTQSVSFYPYGQDKGTPGANDNWKVCNLLAGFGYRARLRHESVLFKRIGSIVVAGPGRGERSRKRSPEHEPLHVFWKRCRQPRRPQRTLQLWQRRNTQRSVERRSFCKLQL